MYVYQYERDPLKTELTLTPTASRPMEVTLSVDTVTFGKAKFVTVIDTFSRHLKCSGFMS